MPYTLLSTAVGTIQARGDQRDRLEEFTERVASGEFHIQTDRSVPSACIDGRCGGTVRPNAAGGTNTIVVAEDLTNDTETGYIETYHSVAERLKTAGLPLGGHDDEHADGAKSGCGACDRLAEIYKFIAANSVTLKSIVESFDIAVPDKLNDLIVANASARNDFADGGLIKAELENGGGTVDHLRGAHNEVAAVLNLRVGTTLDRDALEAEFGPNYEAFNVDVWAFMNAAPVIESNVDYDAKLVAMLYYNLATAHVLCGPEMRVIVLN